MTPFEKQSIDNALKLNGVWFPENQTIYKPLCGLGEDYEPDVYFLPQVREAELDALGALLPRPCGWVHLFRTTAVDALRHLSTLIWVECRVSGIPPQSVLCDHHLRVVKEL